MTIFEYLLVLFSVVLGLAVTQLATGIGELIRSRKSVRWSLPHALWMAYAFTAILDMWTSGWLLRTEIRWSLFAILLMLSAALAVYLATLWLIPRHIGDEPIDLAAFHLHERRHFLAALLVYCGLGFAVNLFLLPKGAFDLANYFAGIPLLVSMLAAWISPRRWIQVAAPSLVLILVAIYFVIYFPSIG